jgi:hypothetical protein
MTAIHKPANSIRVALVLSLLGLGAACASGAQKGDRTTAVAVRLGFQNTDRGIELRRIGLDTTIVPGPKTPLDISLSVPPTAILLSVRGSTEQSLCAGSGACAVAVRYKIGNVEKTIFLVRAGAELLVFCPDAFRKTKDGALLRHAAIVRVQELGGATVTADQKTEVSADFKGPE